MNPKITLIQVAFINPEGRPLIFRDKSGFYVFPPHAITDKFSKERAQEYISIIKGNFIPNANLIEKPEFVRERTGEKLTPLKFYSQKVQGNLNVSLPIPYENYQWYVPNKQQVIFPSPETGLTLEELAKKGLIK